VKVCRFQPVSRRYVATWVRLCRSERRVRVRERAVPVVRVVSVVLAVRVRAALTVPLTTSM